MSRDFVLAEGEALHWQGRPAPRCYTFRNWRQSLFGGAFLVACAVWQLLSLSMAKSHDQAWLGWLPLPFLLYAGYLTFGHLLLARLEWNRLRYAITDRRLLVQCGLLRMRLESVELAEITYFRLDYQGEELGTLKIYQGAARQLVLHCVEHPRQPVELLEAAMRASGAA